MELRREDAAYRRATLAAILVDGALSRLKVGAMCERAGFPEDARIHYLVGVGRAVEALAEVERTRMAARWSSL